MVPGLLIAGLRTYRRVQARDALNEFGAFQRPPLEILFPRTAVANESSRDILEPGMRAGIWTLHERDGNPPTLEVRLSDQGQRWFSVVGSQVVATFAAGEREVTRIAALQQTFPSRQVRFLYRWRELHPASTVLGTGIPEVGKQYEGEALFLFETDRWRLMHWATPEFDRAVARFKALEAATK